jgi:hypothetical protein
VGQLVVKNVPIFLVRTCMGHDHPIFKELGETSHTFPQQFKDHIGLLKIVMRVVQDDGHSFLNLTSKILLNLPISILTVLGSKLSQLLTARVEIDVKMGGLQVRPVERLILDLVLAEALCQTDKGQQQYHDTS